MLLLGVEYGASFATERQFKEAGVSWGEKKSLRTIEVEMVDILVFRFKTEMSTISNQLSYQFAFGAKIVNFESS